MGKKAYGLFFFAKSYKCLMNKYGKVINTQYNNVNPSYQILLIVRTENNFCLIVRSRRRSFR